MGFVLLAAGTHKSHDSPAFLIVFYLPQGIMMGALRDYCVEESRIQT